MTQIAVNTQMWPEELLYWSERDFLMSLYYSLHLIKLSDKSLAGLMGGQHFKSCWEGSADGPDGNRY